jgi:GNAT superfamily N-acetyltransferase
MDWYKSLAQYFPREEFRVPGHFRWLMEHRPDIYRVYAEQSHVLLAMEYPELFFIDYLYVYPGYRGKGVGTEVMRWLKSHGKAVVLEAEPVDPTDPDSVGRRRFYDREGFRTATSLSFRLPSLLTDTFTDLDVLFWAPWPVSDGRLFAWMEQYYQDLYAGIDPAIYGKSYPPVEQALKKAGG